MWTTFPQCMEDVDVPLTADDIPFSCDDCGKTLPSLNSWTAHSQFKCPRTQSFEQPTNAPRDVNLVHISSPHDDNLIYCSLIIHQMALSALLQLLLGVSLNRTCKKRTIHITVRIGIAHQPVLVGDSFSQRSKRTSKRRTANLQNGSK